MMKNIKRNNPPIIKRIKTTVKALNPTFGSTDNLITVQI